MKNNYIIFTHDENVLNVLDKAYPNDKILKPYCTYQMKDNHDMIKIQEGNVPYLNPVKWLNPMNVSFDPGCMYISEDLLIYPRTRSVYKNHKLLQVSSMEFALLILFLQNPTMILTRDVLLDKLETVGRSSGIQDNTLTVHILRLKKALGKYEGKDRIECAYGLGYRWVFQVEKKQASRNYLEKSK